jgi:hypothetical protein
MHIHEYLSKSEMLDAQQGQVGLEQLVLDLKCFPGGFLLLDGKGDSVTRDSDDSYLPQPLAGAFGFILDIECTGDDYPAAG